ncbi:uncharacterized protein [Aegilops tauschii subsp. strangulata]|uniref:uncharacterized protein n=1 Tax=Aegilops tauschii subsp. strangulata TaxID=200361 RepID=UPI00098BB817|nr:uncharacterized protein LOC109765163 [Aegilops tauschii subsp. strangulata]XP_044440714.1 uncharacterized protein LOC123166955 [Triticum aestivum]
MAAANGTAEFAGLRHNGIKFLLDPVDRLPLREVTAGDGHPDPLVLMAVGPTAPARADSSCAVTVGELGGTAGQSNSAQKRKQSPTQSVESTGMVNLDAPDWTRRFQYREFSADVEQPDPLVSMVVGPSALTCAESSCTIVLGQLGGTAEQSNSAGKRKESFISYT